jgi:hypothetical protein
MPQSRQTTKFDQLSQLRWMYRLALGQPHQQDFIDAVSQLPKDGRHKFALCLSAWTDERDAAKIAIEAPAAKAVSASE